MDEQIEQVMYSELEKLALMYIDSKTLEDSDTKTRLQGQIRQNFLLTAMPKLDEILDELIQGEYKWFFTKRLRLHEDLSCFFDREDLLHWGVIGVLNGLQYYRRDGLTIKNFLSNYFITAVIRDSSRCYGTLSPKYEFIDKFRKLLFNKNGQLSFDDFVDKVEENIPIILPKARIDEKEIREFAIHIANGFFYSYEQVQGNYDARYLDLDLDPEYIYSVIEHIEKAPDAFNGVEIEYFQEIKGIFIDRLLGKGTLDDMAEKHGLLSRERARQLQNIGRDMAKEYLSKINVDLKPANK